MQNLQNLSIFELLNLCKELASSDKLDAFEKQTLFDIQDNYFEYGHLSSAQRNFLEEIIIKHSNN